MEQGYFPAFGDFAPPDANDVAQQARPAMPASVAGGLVGAPALSGLRSTFLPAGAISLGAAPVPTTPVAPAPAAPGTATPGGRTPTGAVTSTPGGTTGDALGYGRAARADARYPGNFLQAPPGMKLRDDLSIGQMQALAGLRMPVQPLRDLAFNQVYQQTSQRRDALQAQLKSTTDKTLQKQIADELNQHELALRTMVAPQSIMPNIIGQGQALGFGAPPAQTNYNGIVTP